MKILILTERFFPEEFLINDIASEWKDRGYDIEVLAQVPSYPKDKIFQGYKNKLFQTTCEYKNIPVHRVRTVLGYNTGGARQKIINYINFAFLTSLWALFNGWKYKRVFVYHTGPLSMASAALILHFIWWKKCIIWTQDVWPDTVYSYGIRKTWYMEIFLNSIVRILYWPFSLITVSCPKFSEIIKKYSKKEIIFLPQWATNITPVPDRVPDGRRIFTYAGNIGSVQNLEMVVDAFGELRPQNAVLKIIGDGVFLNRLKDKIKDNGYENVVLTGRRPLSEMPQHFSESDVLIISLKPEFDLTIPAKFQAYIAAGRPLLGIIRGDTASFIEEYHLGLTADPSDKNSIMKAFDSFCHASDESLKQWKENSIRLSSEKFSRDIILPTITKLIFSP